MRRLLLLGCVVPAHALAQPVPPSPSEPAPAPASEPTAEVKPAEPAPPPAPPVQAVYQPPPPASTVPPEPGAMRTGLTFEVNLGFGWNRTSPEGDDGFTSDVGIGGLSAGVGGWLSPKLAITGRLASTWIFESGAQQNALFIGPSAQYWVDDRTWLGGGLGFGILAATDTDGNRRDTNVGLGFDLRIGYTFSRDTRNTFNASLELTPSYYSDNGTWAVITGIGILAGYQHL